MSLTSSRRLFDLLLLVGLIAALALIWRWRNDQFKGYGLQATYHAGTDFKGEVFRRGVEPHLFFSSETEPHFDRSSFSAVWSGTIVLPRTGRYVFATDSDDGSWVDLDGTPVVVNGGVHTKRRVEAVLTLPAGPHAIEVRYVQLDKASLLRLYWTPAGRKGGLEYVPPTVLFPVPPAEVDARRAHPIPPRDSRAICFMALALALTLALLGRRPLSRYAERLRAEPWARVDLALFLGLASASLALRLWQLSGAGQTWDEDVYWSAGRNFIQNILDGKLAASNWAWNLEHPALAKWLYGPATLIADHFGPARAMAALIGALTCGFVFLAGRDMLGRGVGALGGTFCAVMPHLVAHSKIVGLEAPSGFFFTLGLWLFFRSVRENKNSGYHLAAGLAAGLAASTRLTNLSVLLAMGLLYLAAHRRTILEQRRFPVPITLGLLPVAAGITFVGIWPYLWSNPLQHLGEMLVHWTPDTFQEWFLGAPQDPPRYYFPLYFAVTTPAAALAALLLFFPRCVVRRDLGHLAVLLWLAAPFIVALSPMARDGVRYLYPALPAGCLMAAAGLEWLAVGVARLVRRRGAQPVALAVLGAAMGIYVLRAGLSVHPYYLDYYNELTGGPAQVERKQLFEIAWWGEGLSEATAYIGHVAPRDARVWVYANPRHVIELRPDVRWADDASADYILYNKLFNPPLRAPDFRVAHVVRAGKAPLVWVYERSPRPPAPRVRPIPGTGIRPIQAPGLRPIPSPPSGSR